MATTVAERALLDTNVLLAATDEGRDQHARAIETLDEWPAAGTTLYTSGQILREYLAVATRPLLKGARVAPACDTRREVG
jgi:predicted nucleic acid-binding protein